MFCRKGVYYEGLVQIYFNHHMDVSVQLFGECPCNS